MSCATGDVALKGEDFVLPDDFRERAERGGREGIFVRAVEVRGRGGKSETLLARWRGNKERERGAQREIVRHEVQFRPVCR